MLAEQARKPGGRINSLIVEHEEEPKAPLPVAKETLPEEPPQWFVDHMNKLGDKGRGKGDRKDTKGKGKGIRITFEGCWHCGKAGHSRGKCAEFQKLLANANKGQIGRNGSFRKDTWASMRKLRRRPRPRPQGQIIEGQCSQ